MNEVVIFGLSALFICFTVTNFFLSRIPLEIYAEDYDYRLDPLFTVFFVMLLGGIGCFMFFPPYFDTVKDYGYLDFILPFVFSGVIYFCYLLGIDVITNIVSILLCLIMAFIQPDDFRMFNGYLPYWQDRLLIAGLLFVISKGMSLLNGLGAIASAQFMLVMLTSATLAYFGVAPKLLAVVGAAYGGAMLAFTFFSWPPEKLIMTNGGFASIGFILGCFMLNMSVEYSATSMFIATSFLFTEVGYVLYNRYILNHKKEQAYMNSTYYNISNEGEYEREVVIGVMKIFFVNFLLSILQIASDENVALPFFSVALNMWMLSVLAGDATSMQMFSITKWGFRSIKGMISGKNKNEENIEQTSEVATELKEETKKEKTTKNKKNTKSTQSTVKPKKPTTKKVSSKKSK